MNFTIVKPEDFEYKEPEKNARKSWSVYLRHKGKPVAFNLPKLRVPFGISRWDDTKETWNMELSCPPEVVTFFDRFDKANIDNITSFKEIVFRKSKTPEDVASEYRRMTQQPNDKFQPNLRVKVGPSTEIEIIKDGKRSRKSGKLEDITKGCTVQTHVQCVGTYFNSGGWGVTLVCKAMRLFPKENLSPFVDDIPFESDEEAGGEEKVNF